MNILMRRRRLTGLADGIFAIVMTLLVLELNVPLTIEMTSNMGLWNALVSMKISFLTYVFSFALLFVYWKSHHFIVSLYAKNIDSNLTTINAVFFIFVALIPFTTHFLALYNTTELAIAIYGGNIIVIGLILFLMKRYVIVAHDIKNTELTVRDLRHGDIRILLPVYFAAAAIIISFYSTTISLTLFSILILFNLIPSSSDIVVWFLKPFYSEKKND